MASLLRGLQLVVEGALLLPPCRVLAPGTWARSRRLALPHPRPLAAASWQRDLLSDLVQARVNWGQCSHRDREAILVKPRGGTAGWAWHRHAGSLPFRALLDVFFLLLSN